MFPIWHRLRVRASVRPIVERLADPPTLNPNLQQTRVPTDDDLDSMKSALTETLVRKMRATFATEGDTTSQDIVGEEVVAFMTNVGSVKENEIAQLERRISARLKGEAEGFLQASLAASKDSNARSAPKPRERRFDPNGVKDEWAEISKWRSREGERLKAEALIKKRNDQVAMANALAAQTAAKDKIKQQELEAKRQYKIEEEARLEQWKLEELQKLEKKQLATEKLKSERRAQMADKTARLNAQIAAKHEENAALRRQLAAQYRKKMIEDAEKKEKVIAETEKLKKSNEETLRIREDNTRKEAEDDLMYQRLYAEKLEKQEAAYLANIQNMKDRQNLMGAAMGTEPLSERRYYDEEMIAENARLADEKAAAREARDIERAQTLAMSTRLALGEQIRAKQERLDRERVDAARKHQRFARVVDTLEQVEKTSLADARARRVGHLQQLELQMRDNQTRKTVFPMTDTERALNSGLLQQVRGGV
mgnify:CR=1 FL=1